MSTARRATKIGATVVRVPPHSLDAEKSVLGSVFIKPSAFNEIALQVDDFFLPAHREVMEAMLAVDKRRQPLDVVAVADELKTRGMLPRLEGGEGFLLALANAVPTAENVAHYARLVKEKSTLRRLIAACAEVQSRAYGDIGEFDAFAREAADQVGIVCRAATSPRIRTPAERAATLGTAAPPIATEIATLDRSTRGGLRPGGIVVVGGAPSSGKTTFAAQLARVWAAAGVPVAFLAADEPADGVLIRIGQAFGFNRAALEIGDPAERDRLAAELRSIPSLALVDGDEDRATVGDVAAWLRARARGAPAVLIVDSVQTVRAIGTDDARDPRARVGAVMTALKTAARSGLLVVATCEVSRGAYSSRNPADRVDDLAAFKESGAIEYGAHLALVLRSVAGEVGLVDVTQPKNRWAADGQRPAFRLALNFRTATFTETAPPAESGGAELDTATLLETDMSLARKILRENPGLAGTDRLRAMMKIGKTRAASAVRQLERDGEIQNQGPRNRPRLFLVTPQLAPTRPNSPGQVGLVYLPNSPTPLRGASCGASSGRGQAGEQSEDPLGQVDGDPNDA